VSLMGCMLSLVNWGCCHAWQVHQQFHSSSIVAYELMCKTKGLGCWSHACSRCQVMIVVTSVVCVYNLGLTLYVRVNVFKVFFICCVSVNANVGSQNV
jgi:hypothetical protein